MTTESKNTRISSIPADANRNSTDSIIDTPTASGTAEAAPTAPVASDAPTEIEEAAEPAEASFLYPFIIEGFRKDVTSINSSARAVALRLTREVERICRKSDRIQQSGEAKAWKENLANHRINKCLTYYRAGSRRGRVDLHSSLSAMVYRHIAPSRGNYGFQARYNMIEDFMQGFYIEVMKSFRRENELPETYRPRTRIELAEYMAFTEQYAKRRISLPGRRNQQLVVLRAQAFCKRQPSETSIDFEAAIEAGRTEADEMYSRTPLVQQVKEQMVSDAVDPSDAVLRERVISELVAYLTEQDQQDCLDYLALKLQDMSAPEIDQVLGLTPRQRDYLQQRFKYHVEKFACSRNWQIVHQWLGADLDQNLGLSERQWEQFFDQLTSQQRQLLHLKRQQIRDRDNGLPTDREIAKILNCTPKQVQRNWVRLLGAAWKFRNTEVERVR